MSDAHVNDVTLTARIVERKVLRFTPAGLPVSDLMLHHESVVVEAGASRKVVLDLKSVAIGPLAEKLQRADMGAEYTVKGFLGMTRNGRGLLLHITSLEATH